MDRVNGATEVLLVANNPKLSESGGGHGAKGVDFPRWWAVFRMIELEKVNEPDFLLLFESIQDITELDSASNPTRAKVYQVKKKDSGTWSWSVLTGTVSPKIPSSTPKKPKKPALPSKAPTFEKVHDSALGKLYLSLHAFNSLPVEGIFLSNAGCEFPLADGSSTAVAMPCTLSDLAHTHVKLLKDAFASLTPTVSDPDLSRFKLQKVAIHPDDMTAPAIAAAFDLINERSPEHTAQAKIFVESLVMKLSPLSRRTDVCLTYEDLVRERGFTREAFRSALAALQAVPDRMNLLEMWLSQLQSEGMDFMTLTSIRVNATKAQQDRLSGGNNLSKEIDKFCDIWISDNHPPAKLLPYVTSALDSLKENYNGHRESELIARFIMRAITICVDPNSDSSSEA
ncbi:dsDNA nuclease domain-containing protein [Yersinia enterocolitica]|uniref:dsDNA nuclease domain-containing protein n=1 Tax=Yersinia enterocolitica TaxID=630 RepID=UPI003D07A7B3